MEKDKTPAPKSSAEKQKRAINEWARYGGLAIQLFGTCLAGALLGNWLDKRYHDGQAMFAPLLAILFLVASLYSLYRQLTR